MKECPRGLGPYLGSQCKECKDYREEFAGAILMGFWTYCDFRHSAPKVIEK